MKKIRDNTLGKTRDERESCFGECAIEHGRPKGERA